MVRVVVVLRAYGSVRRQEDLPGVAVGQAGHQVVVDIGDAVQLLRDTVDPVQGIIGEDRAFLHFHGHDDDIGPAEGIADAVMQLYVRVFLGQQVGKVRQHAHRGDVPGKHGADQEDDSQYEFPVVEQEVAEHREDPAGTCFFHAISPVSSPSEKIRNTPAAPPTIRRWPNNGSMPRRYWRNGFP